MAENRGTMGGFATVNKPEGIIENCYCSTQLSGSQFVAGGFIGKNDGGIAKSYCEEKTKKLSGNFAGTRKGKATDCYYVAEKSTKDEEKDCIISSDVLRAKENCKKLGFDMNEIWEYAEQEPHLRFQPEKWMEQVEIKGQQVVHIKNMQDLMQFAESVNAGDHKSINAIVRLENSIDLKGQQWTPIGYKRINAFAGLFDGTPTLITKLTDAFGTIKSWLFTLSTPAAAVAVGVGVFMKKFSFGDEEKIRTGKKIIKGSLFSYAFILAIDLILSAIKSLIS